MNKMVERNIKKRWEMGMPHHPKSKQLFDFIKALDEENGIMFDWRSDGDGDNGEELMYQFDVFFETIDNKKT